MTPITEPIEFFSHSELACKGTGIIALDPRFAEALVELRREWGQPLHPNSVCRTPEHNTAIGGHPRSLHLTENPHWPTFGTMACDINWATWNHNTRLDFAQLCRDFGWRVGLNNGFIHLDRGHDIGITKGVFVYGGYNGTIQTELDE